MINVHSYKSPRSLDDALIILGEDNYKPIAGGTDLVLQLRNGDPANILDICNIGLDYINESDELIKIGSACTHTCLATSPIIKKHIPLVGLASGMVGSRQIRNRGTIGGNIMNASPCADTLPALLNYDAELVLLSKNNKRQVKLAEFIVEPYKTDIKQDELLKCILCKKDKFSTGRSYLKLGRRQAVNISRMTVSISMHKDDDNFVKDIRIAAGSVFPVASRMHDLEKMIIDQRITKKLIEKAGKYASDIMIKKSGYRWSTPYKEVVLTGLIIRALSESAGI